MTTPTPSDDSPRIARPQSASNILQRLIKENRRLRTGLYEIREYGVKQPGYGRSCSIMADRLLKGQDVYGND